MIVTQMLSGVSGHRFFGVPFLCQGRLRAPLQRKTYSCHADFFNPAPFRADREHNAKP